MSSENANIRFSEDIILPVILEKMEFQYRAFLADEKPGFHKISYADIFKLLGLLYHNEDIIKAYQNIELGTKDSIAYAVELLDNILPKELKIRLFPLVDNISTEERIQLCREVLPIFSLQKNQKWAQKGP